MRRSGRVALRVVPVAALAAAFAMAGGGVASAAGPTAPNPNTITQSPNWESGTYGTVWNACVMVGQHNRNSNPDTYRSSAIGSANFFEVGNTFCPEYFDFG